MLAFTTVAVLLGDSVVRGLFSLFLGLALGLVGIDQLTGDARFSFGIPQLLDGIDVHDSRHRPVRRRRDAVSGVAARTGRDRAGRAAATSPG